MKCEVCQQLLEEYVDSELAGHEAEQVSAHLMTCVSCASEFDGLAAEQEMYARYDRSLEIAPSMWNTIAAQTAVVNQAVDSGSRVRLRDRIAGLFTSPSLGWSFAGAVAVLIVAVLIGVAYLRTRRASDRPVPFAGLPKTGNGETTSNAGVVKETAGEPDRRAKGPLPVTPKNRERALPKSPARQMAISGSANQSDVLSPDVAYLAIEEQETQKHIEQAQNLLRSVRNIEFSEDETEIDVSYEKALSRQLLNENVVLRRDAEMSGKFPVKILLSSLEPFLLDIANLPDKTSPEDLREIKERVQKTEIVAALHSY